MSFEQMKAESRDDETVESQSDQKVDDLLRSTTVESPAEQESVHEKPPQKKEDLKVTLDVSVNMDENQQAITFFPKSPQQYPSVPELIPSQVAEGSHSHAIGKKVLNKMMKVWWSRHERHPAHPEEMLSTIYVQIQDQGLDWYALQEIDSDAVQLSLVYSDNPQAHFRKRTFSGSHAEEHFEKFSKESGLIYVDINADPNEILPEIRVEVGRKLQTLINKRAVLDSQLRPDTEETKEPFFDKVARRLGIERPMPFKVQKSTESAPGIAEVREEVDIARRELAEQCRQVNEQFEQRVIASKTKSFVVNSSQPIQTPPPRPISLVEEPQMNAKKISEQPKKNESEDRRSALAGLLAELATTPAEMSLLREKKDSLLEKLEFQGMMKERLQKLQEEAEKNHLEVNNSMTLHHFLMELLLTRSQHRKSPTRKRTKKVSEKNEEVFI